MLTNIEAVIFDLDGTLIDSMWMWHSIDEIYLNRFGLTVPDTLQKNIEGMSFSETAFYFKNTFGIKDSVEKMKTDWNEMATDMYTNEVKLKKGAKEILTLLSQNKIKTGIATSNSRELTQLVLKALNINDCFETIVTGCDVTSGKPNPDIYLLAADKLKVMPVRCLVFEDIPNGIIAGKKANMKVCAVDDLYSKNIEQRKRKLADYFINDFNEVINTFERHGH